MKSLNPTVPVLPIGIFRYFRAVAYVCIGASPNENIHFVITLTFIRTINVYVNIFCRIFFELDFFVKILVYKKIMKTGNQDRGPVFV